MHECPISLTLYTRTLDRRVGSCVSAHRHRIKGEYILFDTVVTPSISFPITTEGSCHLQPKASRHQTTHHIPSPCRILARLNVSPSKLSNRDSSDFYDLNTFLAVVQAVDQHHGFYIQTYLEGCIENDHGLFDKDRVYHFAALAVAAAHGHFTDENRGW